MPGEITARGQKPALHWTPHLIKRLRGRRMQAEFGALLGAPKNTVWRWEASQAHPDARYTAPASGAARLPTWSAPGVGSSNQPRSTLRPGRSQLFKAPWSNQWLLLQIEL